MDRLMIESQIVYCQDELLETAVLKQKIESDVYMVPRGILIIHCNNIIGDIINKIKHCREFLKEQK